MKPKIHLLALPHTQTTNQFSHCAFTGKVKRFSPMMRSVGYDVIHYGIEGADSGATENVDVIPVDEWDNIRKKLLHDKYGRDVNPSDFVGDLADVGNTLYRTFNNRLNSLLKNRVASNDIIALPFGYAHQVALTNIPGYRVETGIGYPNSYEQFRIFESNAWYHHQCGTQGVTGNDYWFVIPNYFDVSEWNFNPSPQRNRLIYFGRLSEIKGLDIVHEIAKQRPDLEVVICGQGDPSRWMTLPNIVYQEPLHGTDRSDFLGSALAVLMPTRYVEPFGGVTIEAHLCGTPVLGSSYGSFTETIEHGVNGFRCRTLGDYLTALNVIEDGELSRKEIRIAAVNKYNMYNLAHDYDTAFTQVTDLQHKGWYTERSLWVGYTL